MFEKVLSVPGLISRPNIKLGRDSTDAHSVNDRTGVFAPPSQDSLGGLFRIEIACVFFAGIKEFGTDSLFVKFTLERNESVFLDEKNMDVTKKEFCSSFHSTGFVMSFCSLAFCLFARNDFARDRIICESTRLPTIPNTKSESTGDCRYILHGSMALHRGWI